ncbi:hypothetical protein E6O75_ATG03242 [Venturia nashicola]|uniref:Uncharacterized protein n=1 Tax=Venturia nashicola TaxID=86259 RepID=A0A4Z1PED8_9PEZI|nr:hypothetical protein E6O75_ATG03242 [Venturia nashicola]
MASTMDVLQAQIEKLTIEAGKIQVEITSQQLKFTVLNTRLDEIHFTITQLKGFQSQLDAGKPQQSGSRALLNLGTGAGVGQHISAGPGYDPSGDGLPEMPKEGSLARYTTHHVDFVINWMREDIQRYGVSKAYLQRLVADFNRSFGTDRSYQSLQGFVARLRKNGQFEDPVAGHREREATPTTQIDAHVGFHTPPATPQKPKDFYVEFIDHCGAIIHTGDDQWYELRCHICGRNASANNVFFKGWEGLLRHLVKVHDDLDILEDEDDIDYVLRKCALRQVTLTEIDLIEKDLHKIDKIKKEDKYAAAQVRKSGIVAGLQQREEEQDVVNGDVEMANETSGDIDFPCSICSRLSKPNETPECCALCDWTVCLACHGTGDIVDENRAIHECTAYDAMDTNSEASTILTPSELGRWNSKFAAVELAPMLELLDDFCPCTLSGHACKAIICEKKELCLEHIHGLHCMGKNHELRPSCPDAIESGECPRSPLVCKYMHEDSELYGHRFAIAMYHECECFEH